MNNNKKYKEVDLDNNGRGEDRSYRNPFTRIFQYEYALYAAVSGLFSTVRCRSLCVDSLKLYFLELGHRPAEEESQKSDSGSKTGKQKKNQEDTLDEVMTLVSRDVIGHITFPMMHVCAAEAITVPEEDGTHSFIFTDGIYGFKLHLDMPKNGHPTRIEVGDLQTHDERKAAVESPDFSGKKDAA